MRPVKECSGLCWRAHAQVKASRSAFVPAGLLPHKRQQVPGALPTSGGKDLLNSCSKSVFPLKKNTSLKQGVRNH